MVPTEQECREILQKFEVPGNIIEHSRMVEKISAFLAEKLIEKGQKINLELVKAAALLHDIDKIQSLKNYKNHGKIAHDFLKDKYPELARIILVHLMESPLNGDLKTWEEKLVYYADKRVTHGNIVTIDERLEYAKKRYGSLSKEIMNNILESEPLLREIENDIFKNIDIEPDDIQKLVK
jgi:putative nucleotidyltransferase with HDIG domain